MPISLKAPSRMFSRWRWEFIQATMIADAGARDPEPQPMFSPAFQLRSESVT